MFLDALVHEGAAGEEWLTALPHTVARLSERWRLSVDRWLPGGLSSCVLLARAEERGTVVLKVPVRDGDSRRERIALRAWRGHGAVELLAEDEASGASLLRHLAGRPLDTLEAAAPMLARLHAAPADGIELPTTIDRHQAWLAMADRLTAGRDDIPVTAEQRRRADELAQELWTDLDPADRRVLHGDLNPGNVVVGDDGVATAIDPFGQVGDPCTDLADLAVRAPGPPEDAAARVTRLAGLTGRDAERVHAHAYVHAVMKILFRTGARLGGVEAHLAYLETR